MPEPTSSSAATAGLSISAVLALMGVDPTLLVWGLLGSLVGVVASPSVGRWPAIVTVCAATIASIGLAGAVMHMLGDSTRAYITAAPFLIGAVASYAPLRQAAIEALSSRIRQWGGN